MCSGIVVNNQVVVPWIVLSDFLVWLRHSSQIDIAMVLLQCLTCYFKLSLTFQCKTTPTLIYLLVYGLDCWYKLTVLYLSRIIRKRTDIISVSHFTWRF